MSEQFPNPQGDFVSARLNSAVREAQSAAQEQLSAVWQIQMDRVREQLESGWREQIEHIFQERFREIEDQLKDGFEDAVAQRASQEMEKTVLFARENARRELSAQLNQFIRRLKQADSRELWISTLLDAAASFCGRAAVFSVQGNSLKGEGSRPPLGEAIAGLEVPLRSAPAFANAVEAQDTVVAIGTARELSDPIAAKLGDTAAKKIYLFPLREGREVVGVLYAEPGEDPPDVSALELLTDLAASSMQREEVTISPQRADLVQIAGAASPAPLRAPEWTHLPRTEQEFHLRAQRFARTKVAQLLLYKMQAVKAGRVSRDLYATLKEDIDAGRDAFRQQFFTAREKMVDYYHQELVRTLAADDPAMLGVSYPGPLH